MIEPIHRAVFGTTAAELQSALAEFFKKSLVRQQEAPGGQNEQAFTLISGSGDEPLALLHPTEPLCVGSIEAFLVDFCASHPAVRVDYIHGETALRALCARLLLAK